VHRNEKSVEERFGAEVAQRRQVMGLSQKALADRLSDYGLRVDASAISRVETGTRALRISEALVIAQALGFSLEDVADALPPQHDFEQRRERLDKLLDALRSTSQDAADEINGLAWLIDENPGLLRAPGGMVDDAPQLLESIEGGWTDNLIVASIGTRFATPELRDAARSLLRTVAELAVDDEVGPDDRE
jgi:transcriptional regulator with XRE-family HTH domain